MKICLIDHDPVHSQLIVSKMSMLGHEVSHFTSKHDGIEAIGKNAFDVIMCDPSPMRDAAPLLMDIKRHANNQAYVILMHSEDMDQKVSGHYNVILEKPIGGDTLEDTLENAEGFQMFSAQIMDTNTDFPSAGGVISKSAFCQLFLSAIDRSGRYHEQNSMIVITLTNYDDMVDMDGDYAGQYAVAELSQFLVQVRRQSDIIGQTAINQFALLLQRPLHASEPIEAAKRFAQALKGHDLIGEKNIGPVEIDLSLIKMPSGECVANHSVHYERKDN